MKPISRIFFWGIAVILGSALFSAYSAAQDSSPGDVFGNIPLLEGVPTAKKEYMLQLSGTVMNETFSGARGLLTLSGPLAGSRYGNPYLIIIEGFPKQNSVNSFYWDGEGSEMRSLANDITCNIKRTFIKPVDIYFYFLSPALFKLQGGLGALAKEDDVKKEAEKVALPTFIRARAGQLKLRIHSNSVSGTVWIKGYDHVEKAYVLYNAQLTGQKVYGVRPQVEQKKGTLGRE